ncbi:hypothetical protein PLEOSDRAFT_1088079 [Pleurotus ostreatus PC15]|uniref:HMG box domain-containing protein n=1 Tax=Pleurotus ostreatus (strain PC15) TaxID=1137138 RepID=A0A067NUD2_PLEO1|nr:hypothetical protein PLEOSDRAFT_1088079 [Pleurotus ostreatus PC15]
MPAVRLSRRRRSSLGISLTPVKPGNYGIYSPPARPVTFAPNVTPGTYVGPEDDEDNDGNEDNSSPTSALFPPSEVPAPTPARRRVPPGKRRSLGYIPRPPNAFMLFRADFVRQKHVPGSIETNHGSLSKIIGNCWRALPLDEKRVWEVKAKHAKAEHKARYPNYRFRPVHNKNKDKKKDKAQTTPDDERRCEEVAQLLLEGKKGDDLAAAVRDLDRLRSRTPPALPQSHHALAPQEFGIYAHRRSSSVPLPSEYFPNMYFSHGHVPSNSIALPSLPPFSSRPASPVRSISRSQRMMLGQRRASSARPAAMFRSWTMPTPATLPRDDSPLPEPDTSLFDPTFLDSSFSYPIHDGSTMDASHAHPFTVSSLMNNIPRQALGPLDTVPHSVEYDLSPSDTSPSSFTGLSASSSTQTLPEVDPHGWYPLDSSHQANIASSYPSTTYSGSPDHSDHVLLPVVHAPQPQAVNHAMPFADMWSEHAGQSGYDGSVPMMGEDHNQQMMGLFASQAIDQPTGCGQEMSQGYDPIFDHGFEQNWGANYEYNDIVHHA